MKKKSSSKNSGVKDSRFAHSIEDLRSKINIIGEVLDIVKRKMDDGLTELRVEIAREAKKNDVRFIDIDKRLGRPECTGFELSEEISKIGKSIEHIENDIRIIKNNIKVKVDLEEFKMLENRLVAMEKRLAAVEH